MAERDRNMDDYKLKGHPIRWFDKDGRFAMNRIILVGDAAGADPLFGEGISFALGYGDAGATAVNDAFTRQDFSFAGYRDHLLAHPLIGHLPTRVRLARFAYLLKHPWFVRLGWGAARLIIRFTRWRDPNYVPNEPPKLIYDY
jgi:menaquinone-9 beta-reductase